MGSGACLGHRHRGVERQGGIVIDATIRGQSPTVTMIGELVQTGVGTDHQIVADGLAHRRDTGVENALRVPGLRTDLILMNRDTK